MADGLILDAPTEDLDVFECPKCGQTIDVSADTCRFCGAKIDHEAARKAAHFLARVDQACSDASVLRYAAVTAFLVPVGIAFGLLRQPRFFLLFGFQNVVLGFCAAVLMVSAPFPIWSLNWWRKYVSLSTDDEEFQADRKMVRAAGLIAAAFFVTFGAILCLVLILKTTHR
jgi:predicted RNA-binding Zn-ribbon protein involved in translation (DUF1610 family)